MALKAAPELDHVMPLSKGGTHSMDNVQLLCRKCNQRKGSRMPEMWMSHAVNKIGEGRV